MSGRTGGAGNGQPVSRRITVMRAFTGGAWLVLVWVMLWGTWSVGTILAGVVVAVGIGVLLPLPRVSLDRHVRPLLLSRLLLVFLRDLVVASVHVAWLAVRPGPAPRNAVMAVQLRTESDLVLTIVTEMLTLVPGSVVIEVSQAEHTLYAHVLDVPDVAHVVEFRGRVLELEERVVRAIGSSADVARLREATP